MFSQAQIENAVAELKREIALRERVYPKWIEAKKLKPEQAERQIARLKTAWTLLEMIGTNGRVHTAKFEPGASKPDAVKVIFPDGLELWFEAIEGEPS